MKAIFTYPNNAATSYIDPLYVGDASDGFQKRIQDLKDGNYLPWAGTAPVDTVSDLMSNISKFNDYYLDYGEFNHISIHDMYIYPLLTGSVTLTNTNDITNNILNNLCQVGVRARAVLEEGPEHLYINYTTIIL